MLLDLVAAVLALALVIFAVAMLVRLVVEWVRALAEGWRPRGAGLVLAEVAYTVTDPPIRLVRRIFPPVRLGEASVDLAWSIVFLACLFAFAVVGVLPGLA